MKRQLALNFVILACLMATGLGAQSSRPTQIKKDKAFKKLPAIKAWGHDWHQDVPNALRTLKPTPSSKGKTSRMILWARVLGELKGKT